MGFELITIYVGNEQHAFGVHKNLLSASGTYFQNLCNSSQQLKQSSIHLKDELTTAVKLFIEFLYTKAVPPVRASSPDVQQAERLKDLCQLYAFADTYKLHNPIRNKAMDAIQDGFLLIGKFPQAGLVCGLMVPHSSTDKNDFNADGWPQVNAIYQHTKAGSKLREFCAAGLVHHLRSENYVRDGALQAVLRSNGELMDDFLTAVKHFAILDKDPRVRDCQGEGGCIECEDRPGHLDGKTGVWPCLYHVHEIIEFKGGNEEQLGTDTGCYLWREV